MIRGSASKRTSKRGRRHRGVVLLKPDPARRIWWRARFKDPDSGRVVKVTLPEGLTTADARDDWAAAKAQELARRSLELDQGAPRATGTATGAAIARYFSDHPNLSRETEALYRAAASKLVVWCLAHGLISADALTGAHLLAWRASLLREPRSVRKKGGRRGERQATAKPRSPHTINRELRSVGTILTYLRRLGLLPRLTGDGIADGLQKLKTVPRRIHYLKPAELRQLLEAAMRHDQDTFKATRAELAGRGTPGTTARYAAIAPVIFAALVTGMRVGQLIGLTWAHVDLDALDEHGNVAGEIVPPEGSATKRTGVVDLVISPALRRMLAAMRLASGGRGRVFALTEGEAETAVKRLTAEYGAPPGTGWQAFRRTCGCYLTNAPGIFGGSSAYRSAKQLGHSVQVAERHYVGVVRGIPPKAHTVEAAMQIGDRVSRIFDMVALSVRRERLMKIS